MEVKKVPASNKISNKMPSAKKKSILQQVMKPKDWVAMGVLVIFSAVCWLLVLNAYQQTIDIDSLTSTAIISPSIDKSEVL